MRCTALKATLLAVPLTLFAMEVECFTVYTLEANASHLGSTDLNTGAGIWDVCDDIAVTVPWTTVIISYCTLPNVISRGSTTHTNHSTMT